MKRSDILGLAVYVACIVITCAGMILRGVTGFRVFVLCGLLLITAFRLVCMELDRRFLARLKRLWFCPNCLEHSEGEMYCKCGHRRDHKDCTCLYCTDYDEWVAQLSVSQLLGEDS